MADQYPDWDDDEDGAAVEAPPKKSQVEVILRFAVKIGCFGLAMMAFGVPAQFAWTAAFVATFLF